MKKIALMIVSLFLLVGCASKQEDFITSVESSYPLEQSITKLQETLKQNGFDNINVVQISTRTDRDVTQKDIKMITFGEPKMTQPLLAINPTLGLEVPLKVIVWQSYDGKVYVEYTNLTYWSLTYNIKDKNALKIVDDMKSRIDDAVKRSTAQ